MKKLLLIVLRWFPALMIMLVIFTFSAQPGDNLPNFLNWDYAIKKTAHVIVYALLSFSYFHLLNYNKKRYWLAWLLAIVFSMTDEYHQSFVPGRHPSVFDVLIFDNFGALIALRMCSIYWRKPVTHNA